MCTGHYGFSSQIAGYLAPSLFLSTLNSFPVPAEEKHPHNMMLPPPCFTWGWCVQGDVQCWFSTTPSILVLGQKVQFWSHLTSAPSSTCLLCPHMASRKLQTGLLMAFFQQWLSSCHSSIKARFVECTTNSCPVDRFSHLSCGSLQLLQSYHGPLGCFSN